MMTMTSSCGPERSAAGVVGNLMFDAHGDQANERTFVERCSEDRYHFRFIISPEDAAEMGYLHAFTRDLTRQMEEDIGARLDWMAVDHWNTDNPHIHLFVLGVDETGADLVIARDYISCGMRTRAEDLVVYELGLKPEHEIRASLEWEVTADRWTSLDREMKSLVDDVGLLNLRAEHPGPQDPFLRRQMIRRLQYLETMGLAVTDGGGHWVLAVEAEGRLRDLGSLIRCSAEIAWPDAPPSRGRYEPSVSACVQPVGDRARWRLGP